MIEYVVVVVSDTHGGSKLALLNPDTILYQEDEEGNQIPWYPQLTASQEYLWNLYLKHMVQAMEIAGDRPVLVIHNGDECQGNKHPALLVSNRMADQPIIAFHNLRPWLEYEQVRWFKIVGGTAAHTFGEQSAPLIITTLMRYRFPEKVIGVLTHGLLTIGGVQIDYAHHGPFPGSRNWLKGNVARFYLRDLMQRAILAGERPPDVVLRAHYHEPIYEYIEVGPWASRLYITPSYSMLNDYAIQATRSVAKIVHGLLVLEIADGEIKGEHRLYDEVDIRTKEVIE